MAARQQKGSAGSVPVTDGQQVFPSHQDNNAKENHYQTRPRSGAISGPSGEERPGQVTCDSEDLELKACEHLQQLRELEANYDLPQRMEDLRILTEGYVKNNQAIVRNGSNTTNSAAKPEFKGVDWNGKKTNPNRLGEVGKVPS